MDETLRDIRAVVTSCLADGTHSPDEISALAATFAEEEHGLAGLRDLARSITAEVLDQRFNRGDALLPGKPSKVVVELVYCRVEVDGEAVTLDRLCVASSNGQLGAEAARRVAAALGLKGPQEALFEIPCG